MYMELTEKSRDRDITDILSIENHVRPLADKLMKWGAEILLIKCGACGMYLRTNKEKYIKDTGGGLSDSLRSWAGRDFFEKSYLPERTVSAMGAGDVSIAAFLCSIINEEKWDRALHFASTAGALCVTAEDALSGLKTFREMGDMIKRGWEKSVWQ